MTEMILSGLWYAGDALTAVFLLAAAFACSQSVLARYEWHEYPQTRLMLAYLFWLFVVAQFSAVPETAKLTMAALAGFPVMYLFATQMQIFSANWKFLRFIIFVIGVVLALWAIWQVIYNVNDGLAQGPFQDRNLFAACMNLLWFPAAFVFLTIKKSHHYTKLTMMSAAIFIISAGLFATTSRGAILAWLLLFPIFLWFAYRNHDSRARIVFLILIVLLAYAFCTSLLNSTVTDRNFDLSNDFSVNARLLLWQSSVEMILENPIFGSGWGTFVNYYPAYRVPLENTTAGFFAHNDYLQLALEGGVPALLLQICILFGLLAHLWRCMIRAADTTTFESAALLLGVLALFIHAIVNFIFYLAFLNIVAGLFLARATMLTEKPEETSISGFCKIKAPLKYTLISIVMMFIALPYLVQLLSWSINDKRHVKIDNLVSNQFSVYKLAEIIAVVQPQQRVAQETILQTAELALGNTAFLNKMGKDFHCELLTKTLQRFETVRALTANDPKVGVREVGLLMKHHTVFADGYAYRKAQQILNENLRANPYHVDSIIMQSRLQLAKGQPAEALRTMENASVIVLRLRDKQLIRVELLRQLVTSDVFPELDIIEKDLRKILFKSETGKPLFLPDNYFEGIDAKLDKISQQTKSRTF